MNETPKPRRLIHGFFGATCSKCGNLFEDELEAEEHLDGPDCEHSNNMPEEQHTMNETNEHNPDGLTPEQYGSPEWRLLRVGESIIDGDELWHDNEWKLTQLGGRFTVKEVYEAYRRRVSPPADQSARIAELENKMNPQDFEDPEFTQIKAQKDAMLARQNERLRDEGRKSVILIRCLQCLEVPQQNQSEATGAECGGCIAKELSQLRAEVERLTKEREQWLGVATVNASKQP